MFLAHGAIAQLCRNHNKRLGQFKTALHKTIELISYLHSNRRSQLEVLYIKKLF